MKKSLAIICAVAVLITSLCGTFLLSNASGSTSTVVQLPTYVDASGNPVTQTAGSAPNADVFKTKISYKEMSVNVLEAPDTLLPLPDLFEVGTTAEGWHDFQINVKKASSLSKGLMVYMEAPVVEGGFSPQITIKTTNEENSSVYSHAANNTGTWYTLADGQSEWTAVPVQSDKGYGPIVPSGFKGYLYVPFDDNNFSNKPSNKYLTGIYLWVTRTRDGYDCPIPEGQSLVISAPISVTAVESNNLPSAAKVTDGTTEYDYFARNALEGTFVSFPTSNIAADASIVEVKNTTDLPFDAMYEIDAAGQATKNKNSVSITPTAGRGLLMYVDGPVTSSDFRFSIYVDHVNSTGNRQAYLYSAPFYLLAEGTDSWVLPSSALRTHYGVDVANFRGYVYVNFADLNQIPSEVVTEDSLIKGVTIELYMGTIPAGDKVRFSSPAIVSGNLSTTTLPDGVKVNDGSAVYKYFAYLDEINKGGIPDSISIVNPATLRAPVVIGQVNAEISTNSVNRGPDVTTTVVAKPGGIGDKPGFKLTGGKADVYGLGTYYYNKSESQGAKAIVVYIDSDNIERKYWITTNATLATGETGKYYHTNNFAVSYMADGDKEYTPATQSGYYFTLPANFKGNVKFDLTNGGKNSFTIAMTEQIGFQTNSGAIAEGESIQIGNPVFVFHDSNNNLYTYGQVYDATSGDELGMIKNPGTSATTPPAGDDDDSSSDDSSSDDSSSDDSSSDDSSSDDSSDDTSSGGSSDDTSSGGTGSDPTPTQPDYKVDPYTGAAIDYSKLSIQNVTVARVNGVVTIGGAVPASVNAPAITKPGLSAGTVTAVDSILGITKYPSFKVNKDSGTYDDWGNYLTMSHDTALTKDVIELWHYIKLPAGKENVQINTQYNFTKNGSETANPYAAYVINGKASIMAKGEKEWTTVDVKNYVFTLPKGFEGYVRYTTNNLYATYGGTTDEFKVDTEKRLTNSIIKLFGLSASDDVYIAPTIVVTKGGSVPYAAFVDGETNAARNITTGKVLNTTDLKDYIGVEGNENLNKDTAPKIDYTIPKYNGTKYEYGNYEFARVKQFILNANVAKGYIIPQEAFSDGHADKNNDYTKLIDTTIGISKMPLFSITKTTGSPAELKGEPSASVANWSIDHTVEAQKNCGAVMQYIKLPAGLEKPFVGVYMNAYDNDMLPKNIAPYSGAMLYMQKGTTEWQTAKITAYWAELPKGFEGYIMLETSPLKSQNGGGDWAADWSVYNYNLRVANLKDQTVIASAPFWVEKKGDIDYAAYLNDETKAVRDIFTGKVLKKEDVIKPLKIGDTIVKLPDYTDDAYSAFISNKDALSSGTANVEWDAIDNVAKYVVRVFKKVNTDDGIAYTFVAETETAETSASITGLDLNTQYAIVVYGYDAKDNEIFVFDYINASTAGGVSAPTTPQTPTTPGLVDDVEDEGTNWLLIGLIAGGAVLLIGAAVVVILVVAKKRKTKI